MSAYVLMAFIVALAVGAFLAIPYRDDRKSRWVGRPSSAPRLRNRNL